MTSKVVRNHSHWGAFLAEVKDGRIVGVRPFERDPDPSMFIGAIPTAVHSTTRIDQPMVREGWLARGQGNGEGRGRKRFLPVLLRLSSGAWYDPAESADNAICVHGNANILTRDHGTSKLGQGPTCAATLVDVERWLGSVPPIRAFQPPSFAT